MYARNCDTDIHCSAMYNSKRLETNACKSGDTQTTNGAFLQ